MVYGLHNGAQAIIPVAHVEDCLAYKDHGYLLAAERNGEVVSGFDFGNSPFSYTQEKVKDKTIVLTTTNGTLAISMAHGADTVAIGSFLNMSTLSEWLKTQHKDVILLCSGWKSKFNLEDTLFAGAIASLLDDTHFTLDDASIGAESMYAVAKDNLREYLKRSSHTIRMQELHIENDIQFCLEVDICNNIPILSGKTLVNMA